MMPEIEWGTPVTINDEKLPPRACRGIVVKTFGGAPGSYKIMFEDGSTAWFYSKDFTVNTPPDLAAVQAQRIAELEAERDGWKAEAGAIDASRQLWIQEYKKLEAAAQYALDWIGNVGANSPVILGGEAEVAQALRDVIRGKSE